MAAFLLMLLVALIIGLVAEAIVPWGMPGGWAGAIVAGLLGSWVGSALFGGLVPSGYHLGGFALIPSILGAIVVVLIVGLIARGLSRTRP